MEFRESETEELKQIVVEDVKKEIVAFANSEGGILYIGAADDGSVVGLENPDEDVYKRQVPLSLEESESPGRQQLLREDGSEASSRYR